MTKDHYNELKGLILKVIERYGIESYLEIGCRNGISLEIISKNLPLGSKICAVDYPLGPWNGSGKKTFAELMNRCSKISKEHSVELVFGNSRDTEVIERVHALGPFDLVYIDGDHTYEGVKADFENYGSICSFIALDDIYNKKPSYEGSVPGVHLFWDELKRTGKYDIMEIAGSDSTQQGIGVILGEKT